MGRAIRQTFWVCVALIVLAWGCSTRNVLDPAEIAEWDVQPVVQLGHLGDVNAVALAPDRRFAVSGSSDGTLLIWEVATGRLIRTLDAHLHQGLITTAKGASPALRHRMALSPEVNCVAVSHNGRWVLSGASDGNAIVSEAAARRIRSIYGKHRKSINAAVFSSDDRLALTGCAGGQIHVWEVDGGKRLQTFDDPTSAVTALALSPDDRMILAGERDGTLRLLDLQGKSPGRILGRHASVAASAAFAPDGRTAVTGGWDGSLILWDIPAGREIQVLGDHQTRILAVAFSPCGRRVVSGAADGTVTLWDLKHGRASAERRGHQSQVNAVAVSRDGRWLLTGSRDRTLKLWRLPGGYAVRTFEGHSSRIHSVAFSPGGQYLLSSMHGRVNCWHVPTGRLVQQFTAPLYDEKMFAKTRFSSGGHVNFAPQSVGFSPDGQTAVSLGYDGTYHAWSLSSGKEDHSGKRHPTRLSSVAYSPDGRYVASRATGNILIRSFDKGRIVRTLKGHKKYVTAVAYSPDGRTLLSGDLDGTVKLWSITWGLAIDTFRGHSDAITSIHFSPDGRLAATGSWDSTCRIWDVETGQEIVKMIASRDGEWITATPDGYYVNSPEGTGLIHWSVPGSLETYSFEQFEPRFKRPDIVAARLALNRSDPLTPPVIPQPPEIRIQDAFRLKTVTDKDYRLQLSASPVQAIKTIRVFRNAAPVRELPVSAPSADMALEVPLIFGINRITAVAYDRQGFSSNPAHVDVTCTHPGLRRPNLHVCAIGVSRYDRLPAEWQLAYAHSDAAAVVKAFKSQEGQLFGRVTTTLLTNASATAETILAHLRQLQNAGDIDLIVIFMAGHGVRSGSGDFYFLTTHGTFGDPRSGGLNWARLKECLKFEKARVALFLDSCHSGSIVNETVVPNDQLAHRFFSGDRTGVMVFSASKGRQFSMESPDIGGGFGVFTYALTRAVGPRAAEADTNGNQVVEFMELVQFVTRSVDDLTGGTQTPWLSRKELFGDLPIAAVK
jgi:WD40 repeat protein